MKLRLTSLAAALCLLLTGCSWVNDPYVSISPHHANVQTGGSAELSASSYVQLQQALMSLVSVGRETGIIYVGGYNQSQVEAGMNAAVDYVLHRDPLGAFAVESVSFELGNSGGKPAIAVEIVYRRTLTDIRSIRAVPDMASAGEEILESLTDCDATLVLKVADYAEADIQQMVADFAQAYPQTIMEVPQVTVGVYPENGTTRIVELMFTYQNSRENLRQMQDQVEVMFDAAELYVSGDGSDYLKLTQLYGFLMERFDYQVKTSITPAYSLLRHGVGDSKAFATVYAAMCHQAGLECYVVTGTRNGEPWYWNIVGSDGEYFHVDLLRSSELGGFRRFSDNDMNGYVWDYSAYPVCVAAQSRPPEQTETEESQPEETQPEEKMPEGEPVE